MIKVYAKVEGKLMAWNCDTDCSQVAIKAVKESIPKIDGSIMALIKPQEGIGGA